MTMNSSSSLAPSAHYTEARGAAYVGSRQSNPDSLGYALNFAFFKPYLKPSDRVLDFGCGNGGMLRHLRAQVAEVEGLEVNPAAAELARATGFRVYPGLADIPADRLYDVILSNHVLEHVRDVAGTLEMIRAHLRPGGLFVTKLPVDDWRAGHQQTWSDRDIDHHLHTWTPRLFANVLRESGYEVREVRVVTSAWHPRLFPLVKFGLGNAAFRLLAWAKRRRQLFAVGVQPAVPARDL
jgi:SAM-dependent methyltransferase